MKLETIIKSFVVLGAAVVLWGCDSDGWLDDIYVAPTAAFTTDKTEYEVLESVRFTNAGAGSSFVVWTGNPGHTYGVEGDTGFAAGSDGSFVYSYDEPGEYEVVWVASSVNSDKTPVYATARARITVTDRSGGLDRFVISNLYRMREYAGTVYYNAVGTFVSPDTLVCPVIWDAWREARVNSLKALQLIDFQLTSSSATFSWLDKAAGELKPLKSGISTSRIVNFIEEGHPAVQQFVVTTSTGNETKYYVAPVLMPAFTEFSINGVKGKIERDIAYYDRYDVTVTLPAGTDATALKPEFVVMNNDAALLDGSDLKVTVDGREAVSGATEVNLSEGRTAVYRIAYRMAGETNPSLSHETEVTVKITD